ncbi:hypothetical protein EI555_010036 [Monodon monoceros]|uniref:Small ribosomal subunit protein uS3 n=1 Tax=Monodon monoceros TaxID=40151 RepID=A0A4U1FU56_MONMO|nr:hypothetical protein EI555_010036 [Monodon monoceros]
MAVQISKKRKFVANGIFKAELNEFLTRQLAEDGYSGVEVRVTPSRTEIIILATRTQNVLGEKGRRIRRLTAVVQKRFGFLEGTVELYAEKVATRGLCAIAQAESLRYKLLGGLAVRRACYGVLRFIMESGAKGCEVVVSGRLRGQRAKSMKFVDGLMIHSGDPVNYYVDTAVRHVLLRQGVLGIKKFTFAKHVSQLYPSVHAPYALDFKISRLPFKSFNLGTRKALKSTLSTSDHQALGTSEELVPTVKPKGFTLELPNTTKGNNANESLLRRIYILNDIDSLKRENGNTSKVSDKVRSGLHIPDDNPNLPRRKRLPDPMGGVSEKSGFQPPVDLAAGHRQSAPGSNWLWLPHLQTFTCAVPPPGMAFAYSFAIALMLFCPPV